jgi:hypothetical protein
MRQTKDRIYQGDTRSAGKIVSIFEPSAEVIRKGKAAKPTEFGKLVKLQEAENQIVVDYEVYAERPRDADLLIPAIEIHAAKLGRVPRLVAGDAGFYSGRNQAAAKTRGVKRVCIPDHRSKSPSRKREQKFPLQSRERHGTVGSKLNTIPRALAGSHRLRVRRALFDTNRGALLAPVVPRDSEALVAYSPEGLAPAPCNT